MTLSEMLLLCILLAWCWGPRLASTQGTGQRSKCPLISSAESPLQSLLLQNLSCYNDYESLIQCRWTLPPKTQRLLNLTLLHRDNDSKPPQPVSCELINHSFRLETPCPGCVSRCDIPYKGFALGSYDYFSFQANRSLGAQLNVTLALHVQPPAPTNLQVNGSGNNILLTWTFEPSPWLSKLEFEVAYRRLQDSWEDAFTIYSSSSQVVLEHRHLLPRSTYVARVRARPVPGMGFLGQPSSWSTEERWVSAAGDEAQPHNLQCLFDGVHTLRCSWEVRTDVARALPFSLFFKASPGTGEEECSSVRLEQCHDYTRHHCDISVPEATQPSSVTVSVRPKALEKLIKTSDNIQLAPPTLNGTKTGDSYSLSWKTKKMTFNIAYTFQVQYKSEAVSWETTKMESLLNAHSMSLPRLEPSTRYQARVRVKPQKGYNGTWSEWSQEYEWSTEWEMPTWGLILILVFTTLALVPVLRFCCIYGYRLNRKWEEKIPNPSKSRLFQNGSSGLRLPDSWSALDTRSHPNKELGSSLLSELQGVVPRDFGHSKVSLVTTEDPGWDREAPAEADLTPTSSEKPPSCPPPGSPENLHPGLHFNGPYLGLSHSHSMPNLGELQKHPPADTDPQPLPPGSLDYLCLPPGGQRQLVPLKWAKASPGAEAPSLVSGPPDLSETSQEAKDSSSGQATSSGDPGKRSPTLDYITAAHLNFCPPQLDPSLCPGLPEGPQGALIPSKPQFGDYVELPPTSGHNPPAPLISQAPPATSSTPTSPEEPSPAPSHPEELLVLQQVGDYCFLPGLAPGSSSSPGKCPPVLSSDMGDHQVLQSKKPPGPAAPQLPAIQLFKALKQQDYLALPTWDGSRPGQICFVVVVVVSLLY
ncbi:cytokine receptor common subunit beta [Suncus etruscus]|uniref:cytokine receptor common subunit beta n=1 Tax=Suncus etruscus TaxID=109475 RepID=UPI00210F826E|nr:cytokine receptor common subunit beta [Suncus etruscus]